MTAKEFWDSVYTDWLVNTGWRIYFRVALDRVDEVRWRGFEFLGYDMFYWDFPNLPLLQASDTFCRAIPFATESCFVKMVDGSDDIKYH